MNIIIRNDAPQPIYEQITQQIRAMILRGELAAGYALPSMRLLAKDLRISVITTKRAYEDLEREGLIYTQAGRGCYVAAQDRGALQTQQQRLVEEQLARAVALAKECAWPLDRLHQALEEIYRETEGEL